LSCSVHIPSLAWHTANAMTERECQSDSRKRAR
jgi:hypothetical protein